MQSILSTILKITLPASSPSKDSPWTASFAPRFVSSPEGNPPADQADSFWLAARGYPMVWDRYYSTSWHIFWIWAVSWVLDFSAGKEIYNFPWFLFLECFKGNSCFGSRDCSIVPDNLCSLIFNVVSSYFSWLPFQGKGYDISSQVSFFVVVLPLTGGWVRVGCLDVLGVILLDLTVLGWCWGWVWRDWTVLFTWRVLLNLFFWWFSWGWLERYRLAWGIFISIFVLFFGHSYFWPSHVPVAAVRISFVVPKFYFRESIQRRRDVSGCGRLFISMAT